MSEQTNSTPPFEKLPPRKREKEKRVATVAKRKHSGRTKISSGLVQKSSPVGWSIISFFVFFFFPWAVGDSIRRILCTCSRAAGSPFPREMLKPSKEESSFSIVVVVVVVVVVVSALSESLQAIRTFCYANFRDEHGRTPAERERETVSQRTQRRVICIFRELGRVREKVFVCRSAWIVRLNSHVQFTRWGAGRDRPFDLLNRLLFLLFSFSLSLSLFC